MSRVICKESSIIEEYELIESVPLEDNQLSEIQEEDNESVEWVTYVDSDI